MNQLVLHPSEVVSPAAQLKVFANAEIQGSLLKLSYQILAPENTPQVVWPLSSGITNLTKANRKDELWKTTCLEAFLLLPNAKYLELNLAPQGYWNLYSFDSYRTGMKTDQRVAALSGFSEKRTRADSFMSYELSASLELSQGLLSSQNFRLGLTAVIETEGGERSYWSLKHAGEKPDFHDSRGHILEMRI